MTLANSVNSSRILQKSTAYTRSFFMGVTGLTLTVTISKAGAAFAAAAGAVSEITSGWYKIALTTADTGTAGDLAYHATDGGVNIEDWSDQVTVALPAQLADGVVHGGTTATLRLGGSTTTPAFYVTNSAGPAVQFETTFANSVGKALYLKAPATAAAGLAIDGHFGVILGAGANVGTGIQCYADGGFIVAEVDTAAQAVISLQQNSGLNADCVFLAASGTGHDINLGGDANISGNLTGTIGQAGIKKNTALNNFTFVMTDSTTHKPKAGLTVTGQRSIDGGAYAACANLVAEVSNGTYKISLAATDMNGAVITLRFTASGADDLNLTIVTQL